MPQKIRHHFFAGLLVLAPLFLTTVVLGYLIKMADHFIVDPVFEALPFQFDAGIKVVATKITIGVVVFLTILLVGLFAEIFIFKQLIVSIENFFKTIPVFNKIYLSLKEIAQAFLGDKKGVFRRAVFIEYPRKGIYTLGFVTQDRRWEIHEKTGKDILTIFVPSPPNPATGQFVFVPREETVDAAMTVEEGIKLVISGGGAVPLTRPA